MAGAASDTVNVEDVDRFLSGIEGRPVRIAGRPGVLFSTPPVPGVAAGRPRGYLLVEGEDGLPTAKYVDLGPGKVLDDGTESLHPRPDAHLGQTLARGFLGGGSIARHIRIAMHAHTRAAFDADLGRIQATISGHAVPASAHAGFSPAFRDALQCLAHWPAIEDGSSLWPMYDAGPSGERLRAHCRAFPFASFLRYEDLWQESLDGAIPAHGLPPALLARLAGPAWIPGSPGLHEALGQLSERPGGLDTLLDALTEIPLDWVPATARQAEDFVRVVTLAHNASGATGNAFGDLVASAKGDWTGFLDRCMPGRGLLVGVGGSVEGRLVERAGGELETNGQPGSGKAGRDRDGRYARQVVDPVESAAGQVWCAVHLLERLGRLGGGGRGEQVDPLQHVLEITPEHAPATLSQQVLLRRDQ